MIKGLNSEISDIKVKLIETEGESKSSREELNRILASHQERDLSAQSDLEKQIEALTLEKVIKSKKKCVK
jgi:hypothetical protein